VSRLPPRRDKHLPGRDRVIIHFPTASLGDLISASDTRYKTTMTPHKPPVNAYRVPAMFRNLSYKLTSALSSSEVPTLKRNGEFVKATRTELLFPSTDPAVDGDDCLHDCSSCTVKYPRKFEIDETEELYGHVKGFATHLIVATGKTDWVRDVADEKGSIMEAVDKGGVAPSNGVRYIHLVMFLEVRIQN
jgi:hypothetical protein